MSYSPPIARPPPASGPRLHRAHGAGPLLCLPGKLCPVAIVVTRLLSRPCVGSIHYVSLGLRCVHAARQGVGARPPGPVVLSRGKARVEVPEGAEATVCQLGLLKQASPSIPDHSSVVCVLSSRHLTAAPLRGCPWRGPPRLGDPHSLTSVLGPLAVCTALSSRFSSD